MSWQGEAQAWLAGIFAPDEVHSVVHRERSWGDIWKVTVGSGLYWFKRGHPSLWREVALRRVLERHAPEHVLPVFADEPERGWMLTADAGPTLAAHGRAEGHQQYVDLAVALGHVQRQVPREALQTAGLGVFEPGDAVARLDEQLAWFAALPDGHPARLAEGDRERALTQMDDVVATWRALADAAPAVGLDHNDLHAGNAFPGPRISDWGDAVIGHPFCSLRPLLFAANSTFGAAAADEVRQAYLAGWGDPGRLGPVLDVALALAVPQRLQCWVSLDDVALVATYSEYVVPLMREVGRPIGELTQP